MNINKTDKSIIQQNRQTYNLIADKFSATRSYIWPGLKEEIKDLSDEVFVLDLGCGNGRLSSLFADNVNYRGIDNSKNLIKIAKEKYNRKNVKFILADILDVKLKSNKYDLILLIAVLHHLPNKKLRQNLINKCRASLKPGGRIIIFNWNLFCFKNRKKYWQYLLTPSRGGIRGASIPFKAGDKSGKRFVYSIGKRQLKKMLKNSGLKSEKIYFSKQGKQSKIFYGENLVAVAKK